MEPRRKIMLGLTLAIAAWMLADLLLPMTGLVNAGSPPSPLVGIAARSMPAGYRVAAADVEPMPPLEGEAAANAPAGTPPRVPAAVGRVLAKSVVAGEEIRATDLVPRTAGERIARQLPAGYRATSVTLRDGFPTVALYPGAMVDVLSTIDVPAANGGQREAVTSTVVERARVLAVNDEALGAKPAAAGTAEERRSPRRTTVTLAVTPEQAAQLEFAAAKGTIGVTLRAEDDASPSSAATASARKSMPAPAGPAAPAKPAPAPAKPAEPAAEVAKKPAAAPAWEVTLIRGPDTERVSFPAPATGAPTSGKP